MKLFIIGAGATGSVLVNTLAKQKEVERIICVAKNKHLARQFLTPSRRVHIFAADVADRVRMEKLARGSDLVINAASPWLNIPILKLALRVNAHYQDLEAYLGFDDGKSRMPYAIEHLPFHAAFKKAGKLALFDAGVAPGLTNLLVAKAADDFGALERVCIAMIEDLVSSAAISTWSPAAAVDEVYSRPLVLKNGRFHILKRFSDPRAVTFPAPFGKKTTYSIMNDENYSIPKYLKVKNLEVRSAGNDDEASRLLVGLGLLEKKPVHIRGTTLTPLEFTTHIMPPPPTPAELRALMRQGIVKDGNFAFLVDVRGNQTRECRRYWVHLPSQRELFRKKIYATYIAYPAGLCAAAFALEIPHVKKYGTMPPEALPRENRERILARIRKFGIKIKT